MHGGNEIRLWWTAALRNRAQSRHLGPDPRQHCRVVLEEQRGAGLVAFVVARDQGQEGGEGHLHYRVGLG